MIETVKNGCTDFLVSLCEAVVVRALWGPGLTADLRIERVWATSNGAVHLDWSRV